MKRAKHPTNKPVMVIVDYPIQNEVDRDFPWSGASHLSLLSDLAKAGIPRGFTYAPPYFLTPGQPSPGLDYLPVSHHCLTTTSPGRPLHHIDLRQYSFEDLALEGSSWANLRGYGNINPLSIDYA